MTIMIRGLVDAAGSGGTYEPDGSCFLVFSLAAWRSLSESPAVEAMRCELSVPNEQLRAYMDRIQPYTVVELELDAIPQDSPGSALRPLRIVGSSVEDPQLSVIAEELQRPIRLNHEVLGRLDFDRRFGWFEGSSIWGQQKVAIQVEASNPDRASAPIAIAVRTFAEHGPWSAVIRQALVAYLVPLKNQSWRRWWERSITEKRLLKRIALHSVQFGESGRITFWYSDGGLFGNHDIQVRAYEPKCVIEVCLAG